MKLKVLTPDRILLEQQVSKVTAEALNGSFTLLPRHVDFVSALVPGIVSFEAGDGSEQFLAIDQGILVKCGAEVLLSARHAVQGEELEQLQRIVHEKYDVLDKRERMSRSASAKLEANLVRRFIDLDRHEP